MKKILYLLFALLGTAFVLPSCSDEEVPDNTSQVEEGMMRLTFHMAVPDPIVVESRLVDDIMGLRLNTIWLFNFDGNGAFLGRKQVDFTQDGNTQDHDNNTGTFTIDVPSATRIIHFLANPNLDEFKDAEMGGKHENTVMNGLTSTSAGFVYWTRVESTEAGGFPSSISFIRDMARITVTKQEEVTDFELGLFTVCNKRAYGASVPFLVGENGIGYYPEDTDDITAVTLPDNDVRITDRTSVNLRVQEHVFEHPNHVDDQIYLIVQGTPNGAAAPEYYKIQLLDPEKEPMPVLRNRSYNIIFTQPPKVGDGYADFAQAKNGIPYNNVLIAVDEDIPSITVGNETLAVENTVEVCEVGGSYTYTYTYTGTSTPKVEWLSNNEGLAKSTISDSFDASTKKGSITIQVNAFNPGEVRKGTLRIKAGRMERYIKVFAFTKFSFTPMWSSDAVYNGKTDEDVALVFNIPDNYPEELLPVRCLITTSLLDGNNTVPLSVLTEADANASGEWYGESTTDGYKYVYEAETTGRHRLYLQTTMSQDENGEKLTEGTIHVEAEHFTMGTKTYTYSQNQRNHLHLHGDRIYTWTPADVGITTSHVHYTLLPRFKGSEVQVGLYSGDETVGYHTQLEAGIKVRIYTSLMEVVGGTLGTDQHGGRYYDYTTVSGVDMITLKSLQPHLIDVVRFESRNEANTAAGEYKSTTLEVQNYGAWTFPLKANGEAGTDENPVRIPYGPGKEVKLSFDLNPFQSIHVVNGVAEQIKPQATFGCRIYTENLIPTDADLLANKATDEEGKTYYPYTVNNSNDNHKNVEIPFRVKDGLIVSGETVTLKPERDQVDFNETSVVIANTLITGKIVHGDDKTPLKANAFVAFTRKDGTRIGMMTVAEGGQFTLELRGEYRYGMNEILYMTHIDEEGGKFITYTSARDEANGITINKLLNDSGFADNIRLIKQSESN